MEQQVNLKKKLIKDVLAEVDDMIEEVNNELFQNDYNNSPILKTAKKFNNKEPMNLSKKSKSKISSKRNISEISSLQGINLQ